MDTILKWKLAILYFLLFSLNALATSVAAALAEVEWSQITPTHRVVIVAVMVVNWTGTVMAFMNRTVANTAAPPPAGTKG